MCLGLGVNVKFPCDLSGAPYTVVACAVDLPPQRVTFPFSLIAPPAGDAPGAPAGFNRIVPAWALRENVYALRRAEAKFRARDRARRSRLDYRVFRRETVECMRQAAHALAGVPETRSFYTERDVPGLGRNVLAEADRARAVDAYHFYALYYALLGLRGQLRDALAAGRGEVGGLL